MPARARLGAQTLEALSDRGDPGPVGREDVKPVATNAGPAPEVPCDQSDVLFAPSFRVEVAHRRRVGDATRDEVPNRPDEDVRHLEQV